MYTKTTTLLLLLNTVLLLYACNDNKKSTLTTDDKTPVAEEELYDIDSEMTFNDVRSVLEILKGSTDYDTFHKSLKSAEMISSLDSLTQITVFAPINGGFNRISDSKLAQLQTAGGRDEMRNLLNYHIVAEEYDFDTLKSTIKFNNDVFRLKTFNGSLIALTIDNGNILITDESGHQSKIIRPDLEAENGVVHVIDAVLITK